MHISAKKLCSSAQRIEITPTIRCSLYGQTALCNKKSQRNIDGDTLNV